MSSGRQASPSGSASSPIELFLCGDVMTGRGVDQILPHPGEPRLYEPQVRSALEYVALVEDANGPIPRPVGFSYVWGDALAELWRARPDVRIANLETAVTRSDAYWRGKGVHYRMHPDNVPCLTAAGIDCCVLANNHVLDFGRPGLCETLDVLERAGLATAGAGRDASHARAPAAIDVPGKGRVLVFALGSTTSGIPDAWAAGKDRAGVDLLVDLSARSAARIGERVRAVKRAGDVAVVSLHWGGNWGYEVPDEHVDFAHALIHEGADVVHGHSSHHVRPIEIFEEKLVLYGCGDFIDDYEGISGYESFRDDLVLMYLARIESERGALEGLRMIPLQIRNLRLNHASRDDAVWLRDVLERESRRFGLCVELHGEQRFELRVPDRLTPS